MRNNYIVMVMLILAVCIQSGKSQCSFTGLNANYCVYSANSPLSSTVTGGTFSGPGVVNSVFTPSLAGPGTHTITYSFCSPSYTHGSISFAPSPTVGTCVSLSDDSESSALPIGFTFRYFCTNYTSFYVSSNGFIEFSQTGSGCCQGQSIPDGNTPNNLIAYAWTDLNPQSICSFITYTTIGTAPSRTLLVSINGLYHYSPGSSLPIFSQIKLMESSNLIEIHTTSKPLNANYNTTMGIEDINGVNAYPVSNRNAIPWTATNDGYRWGPSVSCSSTQTTIVSATTVAVVGNTSLCAGSNATLNASGNVSYTWSANSATFANGSQVITTPGTTTTYSVSGTNSFGCIAGSPITVTVNTTPPVLNITASSTNICLGANVTLNATGALSYTWSNNVLSGVSFTPMATQIYTLSGQNGCGISTSTINVDVNPLPINVISSSPTVCAMQTLTLTTGGANTYTWSTNNNGVQAVVAPTITTVYTVTGQINACVGTGSVLVYVNPNPTISIVGSATAVCSGDPLTLTVSGAQTYTWAQNFLSGTSVTVSPVTTTVYAIAGTNQHTCTTGTSYLIIVNPLPIINIAMSRTLVCSGSPSTLTASGNSSSYMWAHGPAVASTTVMPTITSIYTVTGSNSQCTNTKTIQVAVFEPTFTTSPDTAICNGGSVLLSAGAASSYTWYGQSAGNVIQVSPTATTIYSVDAQVFSAGNYVSCIGTRTVEVDIYQNPVITGSSSRAQICRNEKVVLTASGGESYNWSNNMSGKTITVSPLNETIYIITGTDIFGCVNTGSVLVRVSACPGFEELQLSENDIIIYPNPSRGDFSVSSKSEISLRLTNELGQLIRDFTLRKENDYQADIKGLSNGVYFISARNGGEVFYKKVIVAK